MLVDSSWGGRDIQIYNAGFFCWILEVRESIHILETRWLQLMCPGVVKKWFGREDDRRESQRRLMDRCLRVADYVEACYEKGAPPPGYWQEVVVYTILLHTDLRICWVQHTDILAYIYSQTYILDTNTRMTPWLCTRFRGKYSHEA